jgi:hypothetical protein
VIKTLVKVMLVVRFSVYFVADVKLESYYYEQTFFFVVHKVGESGEMYERNSFQPHSDDVKSSGGNCAKYVRYVA